MKAYPPLLADAAFAAMIAPEPFARGTARLVYDVPGDPDVVVKKSRQPFPGPNIMEWLIWGSAAAAQGTLATILGRCIAISESRTWLMMERLDDLDPADHADIGDVPVWFNDRKPDAFGKRDGMIKIRDYGVVHRAHLVSCDMTRPPAFAIHARMQRRLGG